MLVAQAAEVGKAVDNVVRSSTEYGFVGALLVVILVGLGSSLWMFGRFLARRDELDRVSRERNAEQERDSRKESDDKFTCELRAIRDSFENQLTEQRKQSGELARSGYMTVNALSEAFHELAVAMTADGVTPLTKSAILRRRQERTDSVLDG